MIKDYKPQLMSIKRQKFEGEIIIVTNLFINNISQALIT